MHLPAHRGGGGGISEEGASVSYPPTSHAVDVRMAWKLAFALDSRKTSICQYVGSFVIYKEGLCAILQW